MGLFYIRNNNRYIDEDDVYIMCRMVTIYSKDNLKEEDVTKVFERIRMMSRDQTTSHEIHGFDFGKFKFEKGEFLHNDGYGLCYLHNGLIKEYHSIKPIYNDEIPQEVWQEILQSNYLLIHARKGSAGLPVNIKMTHPFLRKSGNRQFAFAHNGYIKNVELLNFDRNRYNLEELPSDSLHFLYQIMSNIDGNNIQDDTKNIVETIHQLPDYTGANFFCFIDNELWVSTNYKRFPTYFTLKYYHKNGLFIASSETIPSFGDEWTDINNHQIIHVKADGKLTFHTI